MTTDPLHLLESFSHEVPVRVFELLEQLGLGPDFVPMDDNISGWIERTGKDSYRVSVNKNHPVVRKRFTAAHELGHYIYHRDLLGAGVGDTRAYRADGSTRPNAAIKPMHERQANSFAANLLMPRHAISILNAQGITDPAELAARFQVSLQAMRIRLGLA